MKSAVQASYDLMAMVMLRALVYMLLTCNGDIFCLIKQCLYASQTPSSRQ